MKVFKTDPDNNMVELYKNTALSNMEDTVFEDVPLFINGIKVMQKGHDDTYLLIYQEIASSVVVIDVYDDADSLINKQRVVYNTDRSEWESLPE